MSIAAIIATGVNQDGRREILGLGLGQSEAATFWIEFLRGLVLQPGLFDQSRYFHIESVI